MPSSFTAQSHGSRNSHQSPIKSHRGGYLRCPFNISASYAELAEKRVRDDLARGGATARGAAAVADKDGLLSSSSAGRLVSGDDGVDGGEGRPWSRAGVGASKLSGKEKRTQQEQAELIYGRGSIASGNDDATAGTAALDHSPSQENMFAVDTRDKAALQQVVPRAVREKVKRRKWEEVKQGRLQLGHHTPHHRPESNADAEVRSRDHTNNAEGKEEGEEETLSKVSAVVPPRGGASASSEKNLNAEKRTPALSGASSQSNSPRQSSVTAPPAKGLQQGTVKPKNRMQMLDDLRSSALTGKKRRR